MDFLSPNAALPPRASSTTSIVSQDLAQFEVSDLTSPTLSAALSPRAGTPQIASTPQRTVASFYLPEDVEFDLNSLLPHPTNIEPSVTPFLTVTKPQLDRRSTGVIESQTINKRKLDSDNFEEPEPEGLLDEDHFETNPDPDQIETDQNDAPLLPSLPPLPSLPSGVKGIERFGVVVNGSFQVARKIIRATFRTQWPGYVLLLLALLAVSSMGMVTLKMTAVQPVLKGSWRAQATVLYMFPLFLYQAARVRPSQVRGFFEPKIISNFLVVTLGGVMWAATWFVSLQYTSLAHAYLFGNMHCILIVLFKIITRRPWARLEGIGSLLGVVGGVLTLMGQDPLDPVSEPPPVEQIILGDAIAFLGSVGGVLYLMFGANLRAKVPIFIYMLPLTIANAVCFIALSVVLEGTNMTLDPIRGAFGWLTSEWIGAATYLGIVTGLLGFVSYVAVLKFVPAIVVSVVMLLEPIIGVAFGVVFGVSAFPDTFTVAGGFVLLFGTFLVTWATRNEHVTSPPESHELQMVSSINLLKNVQPDQSLELEMLPTDAAESSEANLLKPDSDKDKIL